MMVYIHILRNILYIVARYACCKLHILEVRNPVSRPHSTKKHDIYPCNTVSRINHPTTVNTFWLTIFHVNIQYRRASIAPLQSLIALRARLTESTGKFSHQHIKIFFAPFFAFNGNASANISLHEPLISNSIRFS